MANEDDFIDGWLACLLNLMDDTLAPEIKTNLLKGCALAHYQHLNMDKIVTPYQGNLSEFLRFLTENWRWKVEYNAEAQVIIADENKDFCVCPLVQHQIVKKSSSLCSCSEGFAERMFSAVLDRPVKAQVTRSILRGDPSCVYTIQIL
jgi:predicted ArsR family transcriptional regulator